MTYDDVMSRLIFKFKFLKTNGYSLLLMQFKCKTPVPPIYHLYIECKSMHYNKISPKIKNPTYN